jgi:integrin-linked kinase
MARHFEEDFKFVSRLRPEATSEDIYAACRDGDEMFCKEWCMSPDHDLNITDQHGFTPMHYATIHGHTGIIDVFINRGARIDIINMGGDTLLHIAAAYGKYDIVQKLLKLRADVDCGNEHGNTPLHYGSFWNFIGICEILVKHGALVAMSNKYGDTPLSKARPRLRKKLEAMASELGQSLVIVPHKSESLYCT